MGFVKPKTQSMELSAKSAKKIYNILRPEKFFKNWQKIFIFTSKNRTDRSVLVVRENPISYYFRKNAINR